MSAFCRVLLFVSVLALTLSACGGSKSTSATDNIKLDDSYSPQKSLADAVTDMLKAQQSNNPSASFALLAPTARTEYKDAADWASRLNELPAVTGFKLDSAKDATQTATVEHRPALDPFKGLSAAKETQLWTGHKYENGWLLDPDPKTDPTLPDDAKASAAAKAWVEAVQACDKDKAHNLQAIDTMLATATPTLCNVKGEVKVDTPTALVQGPESSFIVDQYSTDALVWAKTVAVTTPLSLHVVLAPLGDDWRVFALY